MRSRRANAAIAAGVVSIALLVATFGFFFYRDNFSTHYPIKVISAQSLRAGEIPYWNFYDGGGQPLAGNPNTLTFYPDNILYLFLPPHVAFNLHFLIHLALGWLAMRALTRSNAAAWMYALSGVAISATAFYNLVCGVALLPFALLAAERRNTLQLGLAFGLLALAGEPVTIVGAIVAVAIVALPRGWRALALAVPIAFVIALPQLIAYSEIAREVERAHGYSAATVLNASLAPLRLAELVAGPLVPRRTPVFLFLSLFIGVIAVPALFRRSRYTAVALAMLFLALGRYNPIVAAVVEALPRARIVRFPEKFALPLTVAICVLAAPLLERRAWRWLTLAPLALVALLTIPLDWFAPYRVKGRVAAPAVVHEASGGAFPDRADYRARAARLESMFGAVAGLRYAVDRSPDGMFSLMTRIAAERVASGQPRWLETTRLPRAFIVPRTTRARGVRDTVETFEAGAPVVAPIEFTSPPGAQVTRYREGVQSVEIDVTSPAPALLFVNQTYFAAWDAGGLRTLPLNLDRLGVIVPAGRTHVVLRFGRHRTAVAVAWLFSSLAILAALFELVNRRAGEVERAGDDDRARV